MKEIWRTIKGYEGLYEVSDLGHIRSVERDIIRNGRPAHLKAVVLSPNRTQRYYHVTLSKNGVMRSRTIHSLVAEAFLQNRLQGEEVDHINEDTTDNRACNLRWMDIHTNRSRSKGKKETYDMSMAGNPRAKMVYCYSPDGELIEVYSCAKEVSKEMGINYSTLRSRLQRDSCIINNFKYTYYEAAS